MMQLLLDNLIAVLVVSTLAVMLLTQQTSTQQDQMERQSVHGAKVQSLAFAEWLERDMVRLGARLGADRNRFAPTRPVLIGGTPFTTRFKFYFNEKENGDGTVDRAAVQYNLVPTDSVLVAVAADGEPARYVRLYRLDRSQGVGVWRNPYKDPTTNVMQEGTWLDSARRPTTAEPALSLDPTQKSPYGLSYFYIEPRTSSGTAVTDPDRAMEADYIRLQFSVLPTLFPVHRARYIRETGLSWASTFEIRPF